MTAPAPLCHCCRKRPGTTKVKEDGAMLCEPCLRDPAETVTACEHGERYA